MSWRITLPPILTAIAVFGLAYWLFATPEGYLAGPGTSGAVFLDPPINGSDLQRIAADEDSSGSGQRLIEQLLRECNDSWERRNPGNHVVEVGLLNVQQQRTESLQIGWPVMWCWGIRYARYADALKKTGFEPTTTNPNATISLPQYVPLNAPRIAPRHRWHFERGTLYYAPPPEETAGKVVQYSFHLFAIMATIGLIAAVWAVVTCSLWLSRVLHRRAMAKRRWIPWTAAALGAVLVIIASRDGWTDQPVRFYQENQPFSGGVRRSANATVAMGQHGTIAEVEALAHLPGGATELARCIVQTIQAAGEFSPDGCLAILIRPVSEARGSGTSFNRTVPLVSMSKFMYVASAASPISGTPVPTRAGTEFKFQRGNAGFSRSTGKAGDAIHTWNLRIDVLGTILFGAWIHWLFWCGVVRVGYSCVIRRRRKRHLCVACGYPLPAAHLGH